MYKIFEIDKNTLPFKADIEQRMINYKDKKEYLVGDGTFSDFANGYKYYGLHRTNEGWVHREWAPGAEEMYFTGDFNNWSEKGDKMTDLGGGVFEIKLPLDALSNGMKYKVVVVHGGKSLYRIPAYARYVLPEEKWSTYCSVVYESEFEWTDGDFKPENDLFIYEAHVGMAQDKETIGTYREFADSILPRIKDLGYNTVQLMAIMEHPYYASFGYQVSNFFAPSSRFGTPDDLKYLINTAHNMGLRVILDLVHSHAVRNTADGLNELDGTDCQYFKKGSKGNHPVWGTKLFDYNKPEVVHFLLSNIKYWLTEYHFDGFRFDGVTSMIYINHGIGSTFDVYKSYFSLNTETEAITYLQFANELVKEVNPSAVTICEEYSGMPGMCLPIEWGGVGFDYRLGMGIPDMWIKNLKFLKDDDWNLGYIWGQLTVERPMEKTIHYVESHDQALVGDKTLIFRLLDKEQYIGMDKIYHSPTVDRGIALHKMIRLLTLSAGGDAYLNFMGNEFGHPEWIDFPREGNGNSFKYCKRQWNLVDNHYLKYELLNIFDADMLALAKKYGFYRNASKYVYSHNERKLLAFTRGKLLFLFNFHAVKSYAFDLRLENVSKLNRVIGTDEEKYGGFGRIEREILPSSGMPNVFKIEIPSRTAAAFEISE